MILILAIIAGLIAGLIRAKVYRRSIRAPQIRWVLLLLFAFGVQAIAFQLPATRSSIPQSWIPVVQISTLLFLLLFTWANFRLPGVPILAFGLILNFAVIASNSGWMPISPETANQISPRTASLSWQPGQRFGWSKDWVIETQKIRWEWLSDRFLLPNGLPWHVAFSIGDVVIAIGAFLLLWSIGAPIEK